MSVKYHVRLTDDERTMLEALIKQERLLSDSRLLSYTSSKSCEWLIAQ